MFIIESDKNNTKKETVNCMNDDVLVTVLMAVYKTSLPLLKRSVMSILRQTYRNIEFIIIDDGTEEECVEYLMNLTDPRIRLFHNEYNLGLAASLNRGIELSNGKYIARMDADDYSLSERIHEQVMYMEENSDVDVLACISLDISNGELTGGIGGAYRKLDNEDMKIELSLAPKTFPHPTVMFKTSFLMENNLRYDETFKRAQDYDMWARCSLYGRLDSLQKTLFYYEKGNDGKEAISDLQAYYSNLTKLKCLDRLLPDASEHERELYVHMHDTGMTGNPSDNIKLIHKLVKANSVAGIYDANKYKSIVYFWWGRKIFYPENVRNLPRFLIDPVFMVNIFAAYAKRLPDHIKQQQYSRKCVDKARKEGMGLE